jgi:hypothetical protein
MTQDNHFLLQKVFERQEFGIDFEWKSGKQSFITVIQIAIKLRQSEYFCILLRKKPNSSLPSYILQFLEAKNKKKIICSNMAANASDATKLLKSFNVKMTTSRGFVSIQELAKARSLPIGFDKLCQHFQVAVKS